MTSLAFCAACALLLSNSGALAADATALRGAAAAGGFTELSQFVQSRSKTRRMMSRNPEQLEEWKDSHQAVDADPLTISPSALLQMSEGINATAFGAELHDLCDSQMTRFVGSEGNVNMSKKISDKFSKLGLKTWTEDLEQSAAVTKYLNKAGQNVGGNVIGHLKGTDLAHETVIVGAHYDSVNWEKTGGVAPGVDDNGSGSALVQLVATAMAKSGVKPRRSIMFVGFNAEEEGLVGSEQMASKAKDGKYGNLKAVLIADEVAYPGSGTGSRRAIFETSGDVDGTKPIVDTFAHAAKKLMGGGVAGFEVNNKGFGSDHMPWLNRGIPAMLLIERNNIAHADKWGHSQRDDFQHVDFHYGAAMARLMLHAATALGSPAHIPVARNVTLHRSNTL